MLSAFALWALSLGYYAPAEHWLYDLLRAKQAIAERTKSPRILIISGSNALFGISSTEFSAIVGLPVVNLASHAGLPLSFHADVAIANARAGDVVVMPLEYAYYSATESPSEWQLRNLETWGRAFLFRHPRTALLFFRATSPYAVIERLYWRKSIPSDGDEAITSVLSSTMNKPFNKYSYKSINSHGDIVGAIGSLYQDNVAYTEGNVTEYSLSEISALKKQLEGRGAHIFLTWPVSIQNPLFDLSRGHDRAIVAKIQNRLLDMGLKINCAIDAFNYPRALFFDTKYHLNAAGSSRRSSDLAKCVTESGILKGNSVKR